MIKIIKTLIIFFIVIASKVNALENKIILKVNNDIITTLDVFNEINYLKFFNSSLNQLNSEEIFQISLESVLKYKIKKSEIIRQLGKIELSDDSYLNTLIQNSYNKIGLEDLKDFKKILKNKNIDYENFEQKLKIDILWNQIVYTLYNKQVIINEDELKKQIKDQDNSLTSFELSEIVFQVNNAGEIDGVYNLIKEDIIEFGFENAAIKHSVSNTSMSGGSLGWINDNQISKEILENLNEIANNEITKPIRIPSGFLILKKNNMKKVKYNLDLDEELKKLIIYQTQTQLENYSNLYFNKVKKDLNINAP
jgi:peptidyl-prolyl cis-trans isomerase SurA